MAWYYILCIACIALILVKSVLSWVFGEIDVDYDFNGDADFTISDMLSFKGILHLLLGFSSYLSAQAHFGHITSFGVIDYVIAIIIGIIFALGLALLYRFVLKADNVPTVITDYSGMDGRIYLNMGNGRYSIAVGTLDGTHNIDAYSDDANLAIGAIVTLKKNKEDNKYYIV